MEPLAQNKSRKHTTSGDANDAAYDESAVLSALRLEQNPQFFLFVMFLLLKLPGVNKGVTTFTSICRTHHNKIKGTIYVEAFRLSPANLEFVVMVMAWKTLRRQVVPMDTPLPTPRK